jgi:hypothetical protein
MDIVINFSRPGKGVTRYIEDLVDENPIRLKTLTQISPEISLKWCEENWWQNGYIPCDILVSSVVKFLFFKEWFSVMQLIGKDGDHLGYYVDVDTPIRKDNGEYYLTDLFLDLWVFPNGRHIELDRDEFENGLKSDLITRYQYRKANHVIEMLKYGILSGDFYRLLH